MQEYTLDKLEIHKNQEKLEGLILPILKNSTLTNMKLWQAIDRDMKNGFEDLADKLEYSNVKRRILHLYWKYLSRLMINSARKDLTLLEIEKKATKIMSFLFRSEGIRHPYLRARADRIFNRIEPYLKGYIFDLGCGDGMLLSKIWSHPRFLNNKILGSDVIDYRSPENKTLPYIDYNEGEKLGLYDNEVDTTILWTVLHHSDNPKKLVAEACRVTSERIVICEGYVDDELVRKKNSFFDWYLNRVGKGVDLNVPLNYKTVQEWYTIFDENGWEITLADDIGIDEPSAPEHHVLLVAEPKKPKKPKNIKEKCDLFL